MKDIGDDRELMAEFAEFKELLRRDLGHAPSLEPATRVADEAAHAHAPGYAAINSGPSPEAPRAEDSWIAVHATEEEFDDEPENEAEGGRRGLFFAAAAIVIAGLAALTWVLGPWNAADPSEDPALATAPPLVVPDAAPAIDSAATQPQDAAPAQETASTPAPSEHANAPLDPVDGASTIGAAAPAEASQSETAAGAAPAGGGAAIGSMGSSIPVPAEAAMAPKLAPLPTTASTPNAAPAEPASPPV
ncbi:MAG: hypothetical protein FJX16_10545, partial [Alphaproteobacteria bacterium]|nr:hypothetical protein [Alphaproteobacteria bacterium]